MTQVDYVTEYAQDIINGKTLAGKPVIATCKRFMKDLERSKSDDYPYYYDLKEANKVIQFIEMLPNTTTGEPMKLAPFQKFIIGSIYGWRHKETGNRRFTKATISLSRKQGKTLINAGMAIWELIAGDSPSVNRQIFLSSNSREQSMILFNMVKQQTDKLVSQSQAIRKQIRQVRSEITHKPSYSVIKPTSSDYNTMDGHEVSFGIIDEYAASPTTRLLDVIESSQIQLDNPLIVIISTAGYNISYPFYNERNYAIDIAKGKAINENYFSYVAVQDSEDEIDKPETWIKSNPLLEVEEIRDKMMNNLTQQLTEAKAKNDTLEFQIKNLNFYVKSATNSYLEVKDWEDCATVKDININGTDVYIGVDLARLNDLAALSFIHPINKDKMFVDTHAFVGKREGIKNKSERDNIDYELLEQEQYATITNLDSGIISFKQIAQYMADYIRKHNLNVKGVMYDPHMSEHFIQEIEMNYKDMNLPLIEVGQSWKNLSFPIKQFKLDVFEKKIVHKNNPVLNMAIYSAKSKVDNNDNIMLIKDRQREKIDSLVALVTAFSEATFHEYKDNNTITEDYILSDDFGF